ncbi:MAG TPA: fatty acid desaturase [Spirochaetia bacterium]|nr:fatty acid desaturase [Spirochaetia bacterium]
MSDSNASVNPGEMIKWYRSPIPKDTLRSLTQRSDAMGFLQAGGYLVVLAGTAVASFAAYRWLPLWAFFLVLFVHGTVWAFLTNGFHELVHGTVFRSKPLNAIFLRIYSFLGWASPVQFRASHVRHHSSTLHPPWDEEVVLPIRLRVRNFLLSAIIDPIGLYNTLRLFLRWSVGIYKGHWELVLFPAEDRAGRRALARWARIVLIGHAIIVAASIASGYWLFAVVISGARFYGGALQWLCNNTQHIGLQDNVPDFRLCCRTVRLNPILQFLYFHMNYHAEHHMYAAVPCYKLGRLRRTIASDLPDASPNLLAAWQEIIGILRRQEKEPGYQHVFKLPVRQAA